LATPGTLSGAESLTLRDQGRPIRRVSRYFFGSKCQFLNIVIGADASPNTLLARRHPSEATSYCRTYAAKHYVTPLSTPSSGASRRPAAWSG